MQIVRWVFVSVVLLSIFSTTELLAQSTQSSILGAVTDPSGAPVVGAEITVTNEGTNFVRTIVTDESGDYRVSGLEPGFYRVTVTVTGFKSFDQTRVDLARRVDVKLQVGEVATTVTVQGGVTQIETETASLSNIKTARDFGQLPLS